MFFDRNCRVQSSQFNIREIDNCLFTLITKIHSVSGFGKPNTINCFLKHLLISKFYSVLGFGKPNIVNLEHFMSEGREFLLNILVSFVQPLFCALNFCIGNVMESLIYLPYARHHNPLLIIRKPL